MKLSRTDLNEGICVLNGLNYVATLDGVIGARGGIPLVENGTIIGAVGCAGGSAPQDEVGAEAGASVVNK
jgi:glc operon protein GlcG